MLNIIVINGRATRDAELRRTGNGTAVAAFTLACERDYGEKETDFIDCTAWRSTAEFADKHITKGRSYTVSGRLQIRSYTDKEGNKRKAAEVIAEHIYFADSNPKAAEIRKTQLDYDSAQIPEDSVHNYETISDGAVHNYETISDGAVHNLETFSESVHNYETFEDVPDEHFPF